MGNSPTVTLDFSKAQPIASTKNTTPAGATLDFSKAQPIAGQGGQTPNDFEAAQDEAKRLVESGAGPAAAYMKPGQTAQAIGGMLAVGGTAGALAPATGTATVGTGILGPAGEEITKDIATQGPSLARAGINFAVNAIKSHPIISAYVGTHLANALGIPLPKVLKAMAGIREVAE